MKFYAVIINRMYGTELNTEFTTVLAESESKALVVANIDPEDRSIVGFKVFDINETIAPYNSQHDVLVNDYTLSIKTSAIKKTSRFQKDIKDLLEKYNLHDLAKLLD
ncbi:MAG: hypothetical protein ACRDBG_00805 [Waterburya sp.]